MKSKHTVYTTCTAFLLSHKTNWKLKINRQTQKKGAQSVCMSVLPLTYVNGLVITLDSSAHTRLSMWGRKLNPSCEWIQHNRRKKWGRRGEGPYYHMSIPLSVLRERSFLTILLLFSCSSSEGIIFGFVVVGHYVFKIWEQICSHSPGMICDGVEEHSSHS